MSTTESIKRPVGRPRKEIEERPRFASRDIREIIKRLEEDRQPWILVRYTYHLAFVPDISDVTYEIVIWQTCDQPHGCDILELDRATAQEIRAEYGLTERKKYRLADGSTIYAANDRLQSLWRKHQKAIERKREYAATFDNLYRTLGDVHKSVGLVEADAYKTIRTWSAAKRDAIIAGIPAYTEKYLKDNGIIIYNLIELQK